MLQTQQLSVLGWAVVPTRGQLVPNCNEPLAAFGIASPMVATKEPLVVDSEIPVQMLLQCLHNLVLDGIFVTPLTAQSAAHILSEGEVHGKQRMKVTRHWVCIAPSTKKTGESSAFEQASAELTGCSASVKRPAYGRLNTRLGRPAWLLYKPDKGCKNLSRTVFGCEFNPNGLEQGRR